MGKVKDLLLNYTVGTRVTAFTHQECSCCRSWFRFNYDEAISEVLRVSYFSVVCPDCDSEFYYDRPQDIPKNYLVFKEAV